MYSNMKNKSAPCTADILIGKVKKLHDPITIDCEARHGGHTDDFFILTLKAPLQREQSLTPGAALP